MSKLKKGTKIKLNESGLEFEITKAFDGEIYDIKAMQPLFEWMPNFYPEYFSIKLQDYEVINDSEPLPTIDLSQYSRQKNLIEGLIFLTENDYITNEHEIVIKSNEGICLVQDIVIVLPSVVLDRSKKIKQVQMFFSKDNDSDLIRD
jgi:hypothetical protein